jgi:hypothetical protein
MDSREVAITTVLAEVGNGVFCQYQPKKLYIHRTPAGKASRLASWRKMTRPGQFSDDGSFRGCPVPLSRAQSY